MFTGIVEEMGKIIKVQRGGSSIRLTIEGKKVMERISTGDSIAINGVCLTVTDFNKDQFTADIMPETLRKTNLRDIKPGEKVNIEQALTLNKFLGGHLVSGHIDGTGIITEVVKEDNAVWVSVKAGQDITQYIISKGSVALDGVSLTVARVEKDVFRVSLIPHSAQITILGNKKPGDEVNIECDMIGKYVKKFIDGMAGSSKQDITVEFLQKHGF